MFKAHKFLHLERKTWEEKYKHYNEHEPSSRRYKKEKHTLGESGRSELNLWEDRIRYLTCRVGTLLYLSLHK